MGVKYAKYLKILSIPAGEKRILRQSLAGGVSELGGWKVGLGGGEGVESDSDVETELRDRRGRRW